MPERWLVTVSDSQRYAALKLQLLKTILRATLVTSLVVILLQLVSGQSLCDHLAHIRVLPFKAEKGLDADYDLLIDAGKSAIPCLIREVTNTTKMRDPRTEPGYAGIQIRVGDVAYFVLADIARTAFVELFPEKVQTEWKDVGVLAYFKFVRRQENREWFRRRLKAWYEDKCAPCTLKSSQVSVVYGFRLGMSLHRVISRFPEFKELSTLEHASKAELNLNDKIGCKSHRCLEGLPGRRSY